MLAIFFGGLVLNMGRPFKISPQHELDSMAVDFQNLLECFKLCLECPSELRRLGFLTESNLTALFFRSKFSVRFVRNAVCFRYNTSTR